MIQFCFHLFFIHLVVGHSEPSPEQTGNLKKNKRKHQMINLSILVYVNFILDIVDNLIWCVWFFVIFDIILNNEPSLLHYLWLTVQAVSCFPPYLFLISSNGIYVTRSSDKLQILQCCMGRLWPSLLDKDQDCPPGKG